MGGECEDVKIVKPRQCVKKPAKSKPQPTPPQESNTRPIVEFPHILRIIGPKHIKIMMQFIPSAVVYSVTSLLLITYMSEWKTILQYFPYYNGKYTVESTEMKKVEKQDEQE